MVGFTFPCKRSFFDFQIQDQKYDIIHQTIHTLYNQLRYFGNCKPLIGRKLEYVPVTPSHIYLINLTGRAALAL